MNVPYATLLLINHLLAVCSLHAPLHMVLQEAVAGTDFVGIYVHLSFLSVLFSETVGVFVGGLFESALGWRLKSKCNWPGDSFFMAFSCS